MPASITTSVTINADQSTVWKFLSEQPKFLGWMTFLPGAPIPSGSTFEPKPGGTLRIIFPDGTEAKGSVLELTPPAKLVFTWGYEPDRAKTGLRPGSSRVEATTLSVPEGTIVTLTHSGPMSDELAKEHEGGWRHYLSQLAVQATMDFHQQRLSPALEAYFAASNEADPAKRDALLDRCCEPNVKVRNAFTCSDSLPDLSASIANGLRHMRGAKLAQNGPVQHIHGFARVPWKVVTPEGKPMFKGENFVRFTPRGKMAEIVGFGG
jgi:uncharacterized protein YndB with AHSA1/START domain